MIASALRLVEDELNAYIWSLEPELNRQKAVELDHIALADSLGDGGDGLMGKVVMSLVNIEEEKRLKNAGRTVRVGDEFQTSNPPITINMYLLFSASIKEYEMALRRLAQVIEFFQGKYVFTLANSPTPQEVANEELADFKLILDIHTLNFEQINDLWGSLGGKQVPFVIYRGRLIQLRREALKQSGPAIEQVREDSNVG